MLYCSTQNRKVLNLIIIIAGFPQNDPADISGKRQFTSSELPFLTAYVF